ncbi:DUF1648 domain-containing protein [Lacicoccus qingdaonensis]|uniref:DUF1648 domain-containing protein n=1 Tax=Lacicoccus qingdaonensis TaxID=576118 RepID=A0A1G9H0Z4_9BACL|nr:DUF1648 domain-containing protein [Salinicoccus qingdaonensis]SDL06549.1 Protein of unknown function [Salinicoccus qingdaonensis]
MQTRPKLDIPKTAAEKVYNIIGYSIFTGALVYAIITFPFLPAEVPMHFGSAGEVNRYGSKYEMIILIVIPFFIIPMLEALERVPEMHNYPKRMDESTVEAFYLNSRQLMNATKNGVLVIFAVIFIEIINYGVLDQSTFGVFMIPLIIILALGPIVWAMLGRRKIK